MRYPVIVHKDGGSDYGVTVPDFPGVFSGGETLDGRRWPTYKDRQLKPFTRVKRSNAFPIPLRWRACLPRKTRKAGPWCWWT